eukprot:GHVO01055933.1.p2 GENE.GHVO01055933.1~~GHVO01055933.1.p2  ORF type:complete len:172 (+),score=7.33 GHVO01055933.1:182-697(+)
MANRCMISLTATGLLGEWQESLPEYMPGNRMDGINSLYVVLPPAETLAQLPEEDVITLPTDLIYSETETDEEGNPVVDQSATLQRLIFIVGSTLAQDPNNKILIGTASQWRQLYGAPHWHLWCAPYRYDSDTDEEYAEDLVALGFPAETTREEARASVKALFTKEEDSEDA